MPLEPFAVRDGYAHLRPMGEMSWRSMVSLMAQAMAECQAAQVTKLLVDISETSQVPLTAADRFELSTALAETWDRSIRIAVVARPDQMDKDRFGELVARNRGLVVKGWTSEEEALAWLRGGSS